MPENAHKADGTPLYDPYLGIWPVDLDDPGTVTPTGGAGGPGQSRSLSAMEAPASSAGATDIATRTVVHAANGSLSAADGLAASDQASIAVLAGGGAITATLLAPAARVLSLGLTGQVLSSMFGINLEGFRTHSTAQHWPEAAFNTNSALISPAVGRVGGGTTANYWGWNTGVFRASDPVSTATIAAGAPSPPLTLHAFLDWCAANAAEPLFDLNMLVLPSGAIAHGSADWNSLLTDQLAMLAEAATYMQAKGVVNGIDWSSWTPTLIELGNELYLTGDTNLSAHAYPAGGSDYVAEATIFAQGIKAIYPDSFIGLCGLLFMNHGINAGWESALVGAGATLLSYIDAFTFHHYPTTGSPDAGTTYISGIPSDATAIATINAALTDFQNKVAADFTDTSKLPAGMSVWLTEWDLNSADTHTPSWYAAMSGTWLHAMLMVSLALTHLGDPHVSLSTCHSLFGNDGAGDDTAHAMVYNSTAKTYKIRNYGTAMALLYTACRQAIVAQQVSFSSNPALAPNTPTFLAWSFICEGQQTMLVVNLDPANSYNLSLPAPFDVSASVVQLVGSDTNDSIMGITNTQTTGTASGSYGLPPFSITLFTTSIGVVMRDAPQYASTGAA